VILKYGVVNDRPVVHTFVRRNGVRVHEEHEFEPYFYVDEDVDVESLPDTLMMYVNRVEPTDITSIDGKRLKKVVTFLPKHVPLVRSFFESHYEADIPFTARYMLDRVSLNDFGDPYKPMYLDIELGVPRGARIEDAGSFPIICMSAIYEGKLKEFLNTGDEHTLLMNFLYYFRECDPDVIAGWNIDFDIRVLIQRLGNYANLLSPLGYVNAGMVGPPAREPDIPGRIIFDLYSAYKILKTLARDKPRSYSLNSVASFEFGWELPAWSRKILEIYEANPRDAMEYNIKHTTLCKMLDEKYKILQMFTERQRIALCEFRDTFHNSVMFDRLILRRSPYALPSKPKFEVSAEREKDRYAGATVFDPIPGLHRDVALFDFRSLYPSAVLSLNVSPETLCSIDEADYKISELGIGYRASPIGLMPSILRDLLDERARVKKLVREPGDAYDLKQQALKVMANSAYGAFGFVRFRLYNKMIASSITYVGRSVIRAVKRFLEERGYVVIYGDTDSVFVEGVDDPEALLKEINVFASKWMSQTFGVSSSFIEIEFEAKYSVIFFGKEKKRYVGRFVGSDKIYAKGFEVKRRDCPKFGIDLQRRVMEAVLDGKSESEVVGLVKDTYRKLLRGEFAIDEVGVPKRLSSPLSLYKRDSNNNLSFAWARAIEETNREFGTNYSGQEDDLIFVHTVQGIRAAIPEDFDRLADVPLDLVHLGRVAILNRVRPFLVGMGWDFNALRLWMALGPQQTSLDSFFK